MEHASCRLDSYQRDHLQSRAECPLAGGVELPQQQCFDPSMLGSLPHPVCCETTDASTIKSLHAPREWQGLIGRGHPAPVTAIDYMSPLLRNPTGAHAEQFWRTNITDKNGDTLEAAKEKLKERLLMLVRSTERGISTSEEQRQDIDELIAALEPCEDTKLLNRVYTHPAGEKFQTASFACPLWRQKHARCILHV